MCYKKPGPRCSAHGKIALQKAKQAYENNPTQHSYETLKESVEEYKLTPAGQKELAKRARQETDPTKKQEVEQELQRVTRKRELAIQELRTANLNSPDSLRDPSCATPPISVQDIRREIEEFNKSGDMFYMKSSDLRVNKHREDLILVHMTAADGHDYTLQISPLSQSVIAYRDYDDDEELLTTPTPALRAQIGENQKGEVTAMKIADAVCESIDMLMDEDRDWNSDDYAVRFMYFGEAHGDINNSLRTGNPLNPKLVKTLDGIMTEHTLEQDTVVYRGVRFNGANDPLRKKILNGQYTHDEGYLSTTTDEKIATNFAGGGNRHGAVLKITLPAGTKCQKSGVNDHEKEIALPRNYNLSQSEWTMLKD